MMRFSKARRAALLACSVLALSSCETMNETYNNMRNGLGDIGVQPADDIALNGQTDASAPQPARSDANSKQRIEAAPLAPPQPIKRQNIEVYNAMTDPVDPNAPYSPDAAATQEAAAMAMATTPEMPRTAPPAPVTAPTTAEDGPSADCPPVSIIDELRTLHQFLDDGTPRAEDSISKIAIASIRTSCTKSENNIAVDMDISFEGELGPRAHDWKMDKPSFAYPYFVALTTPDGNIASKEVFAATVAYDSGQDHVMHKEHMRQLIPTQGDVYGSGHEILIGFQLTEKELAYNRALIQTPGMAQDMAKSMPSAIPPPAQTVATKPPKPIKPPKPPHAPARPDNASVAPAATPDSTATSGAVPPITGAAATTPSPAAAPTPTPAPASASAPIPDLAVPAPAPAATTTGGAAAPTTTTAPPADAEDISSDKKDGAADDATDITAPQ